MYYKAETGVDVHGNLRYKPVDFTKSKLKNHSPMFDGYDVDAIRRVMAKDVMYKLAYSGGDPLAVKWLEFASILGSITYKPGWYIRTGVEDTRMWFQIGVTDEADISFDPVEGKKNPWRGAKHYLSSHMCRQEVVSAAHHAIERAELHEVNEWFRYKKRAIYNPHLDPDKLAEFASKWSNFNVRENAMTMEESP